MKQKRLQIGFDVDDTHYHGSALDTDTSEVMSFKCLIHLSINGSQLAISRSGVTGSTR